MAVGGTSLQRGIQQQVKRGQSGRGSAGRLPFVDPATTLQAFGGSPSGWMGCGRITAARGAHATFAPMLIVGTRFGRARGWPWRPTAGRSPVCARAALGEPLWFCPRIGHQARNRTCQKIRQKIGLHHTLDFDDLASAKSFAQVAHEAQVTAEKQFAPT